MEIYHLSVHVQPTKENPRANEILGAYVSCWIKAPTADQAKAIAIADITNGPWVIDVTAEPPRAPTPVSERTEDNALYLHQAQLDGECYVYHTYAAYDERTAH
jgi:hypothetical protein